MGTGQLLGINDLYKKTNRTYSVKCTTVNGLIIKISEENFSNFIMNRKSSRKWLKNYSKQQEGKLLNKIRIVKKLNEINLSKYMI